MSEVILNVTDEFLESYSFQIRGKIVRCRDCRYYDQNDDPSEVFPNSYWCDKLTVYMPPDGFCSFGKRKVVGE